MRRGGRVSVAGRTVAVPAVPGPGAAVPGGAAAGREAA
ncbi:hypothetical protein HDA43_001000 [Streptosporangium sandarakinum]|uniref:Uncharacterized protein n=1 Tax=Streptosporangium sandarakinum TaxID=1260955 RepID=A0A852UYG4_9ACTN|nr:hypothetical protein [Streptosporangium sandarakinum]